MEILALIPARSGSKGIPHKNIRPFRGKPLMAHSIEQARQARSVTRVVVSTDSPEYAGIARQYGAEAPFLRPAEISQDESTDLEAFQHALRWLSRNEGYHPEICVHLRPTYPLRTPGEIEHALELLKAPPECDSVRCVTDTPETPFRMWFMDEAGWLKPVLTDPSVPEAYNVARQSLPRVYMQNASIDVVWTRVILEQNSMTGRRIRGYYMDHFHDIDSEPQWAAAERSAAPAFNPAGKTFVFDIDGVLATLTPDNDYTQARPIPEHIRLVNCLHRMGNTIVLFTARGSKTGKDWRAWTARQLAEWGVQYHELRFGKPAGDFYIDDRMLTLEELRRLAVGEGKEGGGP
jgi:CMP-N-acetylneuraminic acid synthetase